MRSEKILLTLAVTLLLPNAMVAIAQDKATQNTSPQIKGSGTNKVEVQTTQIDDVAKQIGLTAIEHGHYQNEENNRLSAEIVNAKKIKLLVVNGGSLIDGFKAEFTSFLGKPGSEMQVLFGTANSDFYREETELTLGFKPGEDGYNKNVGLAALSRSRLEGYAGPQNLNHLQFKYFDTQYRFPIIIIDDRYCILTIRLSPNESAQSMRMEFDQEAASTSAAYATSCVVHFDRLWSLSSPNPGNNRWMAALGLYSWSRADLVALVACLGTVLAGIGALLALPPVQRLFRLERLTKSESTESGSLKTKSAEQAIDSSVASSPIERSHPKRPKRH